MRKMNRFVQAGLAVCVAATMSLTATSAQANLLTNPGFEDPVTADGPPFVGFWEAFNGGGAASFNSTVMPLSGLQHLELQINNAPNTFAGAFQDIPGLIVGQELTWAGWTKDLGVNAGGAEVRIEWRDSVSNVEITRTPNMVPVLTPGEYTQWSLTALVPAGADTARVVYAIQSFGAGPSQLHFVDDTSVTVIPEPASLALLGLGGLAMLRRRA